MKKLKLFSLALMALFATNVWGAASTTPNTTVASGTITFEEVGTLSAQNTYWYNGLKFYEQSTNSMSADKGKRWNDAITPCQYGTFTSGVNWQAGAYEMTGLIMQAHCLAINVNEACTIEIVVNMSGKTLGQSNPVVPGNLKVFWDGTEFNTAYTSSNYKTGTAKTDTTWEQGINGKYNRMKLSIPVSAEDLEDKTIDVIKVSYTGSATGTPSYSQAFVYESVKVIYPTPTLTGAWKIDDNVVTSANVMQGASATLPTFTVGATSGTPTSSDYTVAYSLKTGSDEGIFTFDANDVPTGIVTTSAGSATLIATLTTADNTKFLTPTTNTFEYTVNVSAAAAPAFTSVTPSATSVVRGTASNIVAVVTGTPTPTIQWYSNTTASNEGGTIISGATDLTLDLANTTVGTFYYYAVATNTTSLVNNVASAVQTITVAPKAPVLPASAGFVDSKSVTIAKADGEAEGAVIKYSINSGAWTIYSDAIEVTETSTIKAKVVQGDYESAEVSATYTKVTPKTQRTVSSTETWDWSQATGVDVNLDANTTPAKDADVDIVAANFDGAVYQWNCGFPSNFDAIVLNKFQRPKNGSYYQGQTIKIHTSVPGIITVEFANTGNKRPNRYLSVNGTIYGEGSGAEASASKRTVSVPVAAGDIILTGIYEPDKTKYEKGDGYSNFEDNKAGTAQYLNYYKVIFTQTHAVTWNANGNTSTTQVAHNSKPTFPENPTPCAWTEFYGWANVNWGNTISDLENELGDGEFIATSAEGMPVVTTDDVVYYAVFTKAPGGTAIYVTDCTAVTAIEETEAEAKSEKFIENGQLFIEKNGHIYNAQGQLVK